jgi:Zn-dependent protease with chaperone function
MAWLMRPRLGSVPDGQVLTRTEAPTLHALAEDVAGELRTAPVDLVVLDAGFNASWQIVGFRRRRVLTLGLGLLAVLGPQERAALVAHELAHARNGDATRGLFVGAAVTALAELRDIVARDIAGGDHVTRIGGQVARVLAAPLTGVLVLEAHLLRRDMQRAEYLADALSARVAGTEAAVSLQEQLLLEGTFFAAVQQAAHTTEHVDLFDELARRSAQVPERERERRRRVARLRDATPGDTHPPSAKRVAVLERRARTEPSVVLDAERSAAIDAELAPFHERLQRTLIDEYRASLYY